MKINVHRPGFCFFYCNAGRLLQVWITFFSCVFLLFFSSQKVFPAERSVLSNYEGVVAYCFDGDTVKLTDRRVVRLAGIDSPEIQHGKENAQYFSREAKEKLEQLAKGQRVKLCPVGKDKDHYGRIIAELILENGLSLNEVMIREGFAFYYYHEDLAPEFRNKLLLLQKEAINKRCGMWQGLFDFPIARQKYIGNKASSRFFPVSCLEAQRIKPRNKISFGTLMDAFTAGFAPARICVFWPQQ